MPNLTRRGVLRGAATGLAVAGAGAAGLTLSGCAAEEGAPPAPAGGAPEETFTEPNRSISGELKILLWSHFVPSHDEWFDRFVTDWSAKVGVDVTVDHIAVADIPPRIAAEISAGQGHDLIQYIATLSHLEEGVLDLKDVTDEAVSRWGPQLDLCRRSSLNPATGKFYAYAPGWVPDPGNFRRSLWEPVGFPQGPSTWDELLTGGTEIMKSQNVQMGLGMSQEIDSNMVLRALMWSFGAAVQDENEQVIINSEGTRAALDYMTKLFSQTMTDEVFAWQAASNNQGLVAGNLSYIVNSISAYRTAQVQSPEIAADVGFVPALRGPAGALAAQHVMYNWIVPKHAANADAAKEFLLHYTENYAAATYASQLYDFSAWGGLTPRLRDWLAEDPFGSQPADKLNLLAGATDWSTNIGHPGPANPAVGEVFSTFVIPNMFASVVRGEATAAEAIAAAEAQLNPIFAKWRAKGLVGG